MKYNKEEFYAENLFKIIGEIIKVTDLRVLVENDGFVLEPINLFTGFSYAVSDQLKYELMDKVKIPQFIKDGQKFFLSKSYNKQSYKNLLDLIKYLETKQ